MLTFHLQPGALTALRFGYSPLLELAMSYRLLLRPDLHASYRGWLDEAQAATHDLMLPYLDAVILPSHYLADFVTPTPATAITDLETEFDRMRETPAAVIRENTELLIRHYGDSEARQHFLMYPHDALECLIAELRLYWARTLAQHWGRIQSVLDADVMFRARQLALQGINPLFGSLSRVLTYEDSTIRIAKPIEKNATVKAAEVVFNGTGLQLIPSMFACPDLSWQTHPNWQPMILYRARGTGLWYQPLPEDSDEALQVLMGSTRARLLHTLIQEPVNTSELANRLEITAGAVSQHLNLLNQAGLVESYRSGSRVYYRLSPRGEGLLSLFAL